MSGNENFFISDRIALIREQNAEADRTLEAAVRQMDKVKQDIDQLASEIESGTQTTGWLLMDWLVVRYRTVASRDIATLSLLENQLDRYCGEPVLVILAKHEGSMVCEEFRMAIINSGKFVIDPGSWSCSFPVGKIHATIGVSFQHHCYMKLGTAPGEIDMSTINVPLNPVRWRPRMITDQPLTPYCGVEILFGIESIKRWAAKQPVMTRKYLSYVVPVCYKDKVCF